MDPDLTYQVLNAAFEVARTLGTGLREKIYEKALIEELTLRSLPTQTQVPFEVKYKGKPVGLYVADLLIQNELLVELKITDDLTAEHLAQCLTYLKVANLPLCLLINFQRQKLQYKRIIRNPVTNPLTA